MDLFWKFLIIIALLRTCDGADTSDIRRVRRELKAVEEQCHQR